MTVSQSKHVLFRQGPDSRLSPTRACQPLLGSPGLGPRAQSLSGCREASLLSWGGASRFPLHDGRGPGGEWLGSPSAWGSGGAQLRRQVCVEKTGIWSPAWELPPATSWPLPSDLGQLQLPASRAKKPRVGLDSPTHSCIQTVSKYFQLYLQNTGSIRRPPPGRQLCSHGRRSLHAHRTLVFRQEQEPLTRLPAALTGCTVLSVGIGGRR